MEDHGADIHNFSTSSPTGPTQHRLPTVTAIEALQQAKSTATATSTSLPLLDALLLPNGLALAAPGIQKGQVTEVFGPPGVGKTTFGLQVAVNEMLTQAAAAQVLWVNTGSPLMAARLQALMDAGVARRGHDERPAPDQSPEYAALLDSKFVYLEAYTLTRVLALFLHPTRTFPPPNTTLIVVDDLSNLILGAFWRNPRALKAGAPVAIKERLERKAVARRFQVLESLAAAMSKMAALRKMAILVLTNASTSLKGGQKAILKPALSSQAWDSAVHTRVMLYRDFADETLDIPDLHLRSLRYADVQRLGRKDFYRTPIPFIVTTDGLCPVEPIHNHENPVEPNGIHGPLPSARSADEDLPLLPMELSQLSPSRKRKAFEIADSEDDDDEDPEEDRASPGHADPPSLPPGKEDLAPEKVPNGRDQEEMILETHETMLLRRYRHAIIRGSEDALRHLSSEDGSDDDDDDDNEDHHDPNDADNEDHRGWNANGDDQCPHGHGTREEE